MMKKYRLVVLWWILFSLPAVFPVQAGGLLFKSK